MKHFVLKFLVEWQQVVIDYFTRVSHLIVFDLIKVDSFCELVGFTPNNHGYLELTGKECYHAGTDTTDNTSVT